METEIKQLQNIAIKNGWHNENNGLFTKYPIDKFLTKEQFLEYLEVNKLENSNDILPHHK